MPNRKPTEKVLYPLVEDFVRRRFGCFTTGTNRGTRHGRVDVVGIRDAGDDLSGAFELIGVEVKAGTRSFSNAAGQAAGYSVYADRCYLADFRLGPTPYSLEEIRIASHLGIGLLALTWSRVREVMAAPQHHAIVPMQLELIDHLGFSLCTVCNSLFQRRKQVGRWPSEVSRAGLAKAREHEKGLVYWLHELANRDVKNRESAYHRRYVCRDCVRALTK